MWAVYAKRNVHMQQRKKNLKHYTPKIIFNLSLLIIFRYMYFLLPITYQVYRGMPHYSLT